MGSNASERIESDAGEGIKSDASVISVVEASPTDADSVASALSESFAEYRPLYTPEGYAATTPSAEQIRARWDEGPVWVALRDRRVVGTVSAVPRGRELYVRSMAVVPSARGRSAGELLLRRVEEFALAHGHERLTLTTTPFLSRAIRLYERAGFRPTGRALELFGTPLFEMSKDLSARD